MIIQGNKYPSDFEAKKQMIEAGKDLNLHQYCVAGDGSISVRIGPNAVWFTQADADKGHLQQDSFIRTDMNGRQSMVGRNAALPEDYEIHLAVYRENPSLRCVIHAYSPVAVTMGIRGQDVKPAGFSPSVRKLGAIPCIQMEETTKMAAQASIVAKTGNGVIVQGDGCYMWGASTQDACTWVQILEYYGKVMNMTGHCQGGDCSSCNFHSADIKPEYCSTQQITDGITPLIRPGDPDAFKLPVQGAKDTERAQKPAGSEVRTGQGMNVIPKATETFKAHPVTISAPSNAQFMKNSAVFTSTATGNCGFQSSRAPLSGEKVEEKKTYPCSGHPLKPVTISTPPANYTVKPSQRYGRVNTPVRAVAADNLYESGKGVRREQTNISFANSASDAAKPDNIKIIHGTAAATSQCPINVIAHDRPLPYKREDGPVKDAPREEIMNEVIRRTISKWK